MTEPRDGLPALTVLPHDAAGECLEITAALLPRQSLLQDACGSLDRAYEHGAQAEQSGGHRTLERFGAPR